VLVRETFVAEKTETRLKWLNALLYTDIVVEN